MMHLLLTSITVHMKDEILSSAVAGKSPLLVDLALSSSYNIYRHTHTQECLVIYSISFLRNRSAMSSGGREEKGYVDSHVAMVGIGKPRGASKCMPVASAQAGKFYTVDCCSESSTGV